MSLADESVGPPKQELPRVLGPIDALCVVVGSVIGSGIFIVPAGVAKSVPFLGGIALVWIIGGIFSLAGALTLAELGSMLPSAGGPYVYLREAYGRLPAFLFGWAEFLVIRAGSIATLATAFGLNFSLLVSPPAGLPLLVWQTSAAVVAIITLCVINVIGTKAGGWVQVLGTALKVGALVAMMVLPFFMGKVDTGLLTPVWPQAWDGALFKGMLAAMISVLWTYDGWVNTSALAEEIREPGKNIPRALVWGMAILITVYLGMTVVYHLVLPLDVIQSPLDENGSPRIVSAEFCNVLLGKPGLVAIGLIVMCSTFISLNGNALSGPRAYFAMARDGVFPKALCRIHPKNATPANAIIAQTVWAVILIILGTIFKLVPPPTSGLAPWLLKAWKELNDRALYDILFTYVIFGGTVFYTMAIASVFILRRTHPDLDRPYKTWLYPITPIVYVMASFILMWSMLSQTPAESFAGLGIIFAGIPAYVYFSRTGELTG